MSRKLGKQPTVMGTEEERYREYIEFLGAKNLKDENFVYLIGNRLSALAAAYRSITNARNNAVQRDEASCSGYLHHYFNRIHNILEAVLVVEATENFTSAEILARSALEYCANALNFLPNATIERFNAFERSYVVETRNKIEQWKKEAQKLPEPEQSNNLRWIERENASNSHRERLEHSNSSQIPWPPTVEQRFSKAGLALEYRTIYWRLSNQVHGDAEDTISEYFRFMAHEGGNPDTIASVEAVPSVFSRWYAYMVFEVYLRACQEFCKEFDGVDSDEVTLYQAVLAQDTFELADWMGKPCDIYPLVGAMQPWGMEVERCVR